MDARGWDRFLLARAAVFLMASELTASSEAARRAKARLYSTPGVENEVEDEDADSYDSQASQREGKSGENGKKGRKGDRAGAAPFGPSFGALPRSHASASGGARTGDRSPYSRGSRLRGSEHWAGAPFLDSLPLR